MCNIIFLLVVILGPCVITSSQVYARLTTTNSGVDINTDNLEEQDIISVCKLIREYDNTIYRILPHKNTDKQQMVKCEIRFLNHKNKRMRERKIRIRRRKSGRTTIYLAKNVSSWESDYQVNNIIVAVLIARQMRIKIHSKYIDKVPIWLTTAIIRKSKHRLDKTQIPGITVFPGIHALASKGYYPKFNNIIEFPVRPGNTPEYALYSEAAELLLNSIIHLRGKPKQTLKKYLKGILEDNSPTILLSSLFHKLIIEKNSGTNPYYYDLAMSDNPLQTWFNYELRKRSVNMFMPLNAKCAKKALNDTFELKYITLTGEDKDEELKEIKSCNLMELENVWDEIADKPIFLKNLRRRFTGLKYELPQIFFPVFKLIFEAIDELESDDVDDFIEEIQDALVLFNKTLKKQVEFENYINSQTQQIVPPGYKYDYAFKIFRKNIRKQQKLFKPINRYLEKVENDFLGTNR